MPKFNRLAVAVLATMVSTSAHAAHPGNPGGGHGGGVHFGGGPHFGGGHFGGAHFGGGPHFGGAMRFGGAPHFGHGLRFGGGPHFGVAHHFGHGARFGAVAHFGRGPRLGHTAHIGRGAGFGRIAHVDRGAGLSSAWNSHGVTHALRNTSALRDPNTRAHVTALAAMAGWHNAQGAQIGWWQHEDGGYGWVGPLFWPFAFDDIYDYAVLGYDPSFWEYGYGDIYAAMFAPYAYEDLLAYLPRYAAVQPGGYGRAFSSVGRANDRLAEMCGQDSNDIVGLPIDQIRQAISLTDEQRAALDDLANVLAKAAQDIKTACPTDISMTAPGRLAAMEQRLEAMIAAVDAVQAPLDKFFGLLNDEQKARFTALDEEQLKSPTRKRISGSPAKSSLAENCGGAQSAVTQWPSADIDRKVHPTDAQRTSLATLQDVTTKASDMLSAACQPDSALTPPARLAAAGNRLRTMLQAVKLVRAALDDFYGTLSDEQKAQFETIGRQSVGPRAELIERR